MAEGSTSAKFYTFSAVDMSGHLRSMSEFAGQVLCIINIARKDKSIQ